MARISWTGLGILPFLLIFAAPLAVWVFLWPRSEPAAVRPPFDPVPVLVQLGCLYLATAAVGFLVGVGLNSTRGPRGRVWTADHALDGVPMQRPALTIHGFLALLCFAGAVGAATGSFVVFVATDAAVLGLVLGVPAQLRVRRRADTTARRMPLTSRGWQVWGDDQVLARRLEIMEIWSGQRSPHEHRSLDQGPAYGVVGGKDHGLPFTVFDRVVFSPSALTRRAVTTCAVHLPVALPSTTVTAQDSGPPLVQSGTLAFARDVGATDLIAELAAAGFPNWRFVGWDLVCVRDAVAESPDDLAATVAALTGAAARLPPHLFSTYGKPLTDFWGGDQVVVRGAGVVHRVPQPPTGETR